jgi:hypothetical protein
MPVITYVLVFCACQLKPCPQSGTQRYFLKKPMLGFLCTIDKSRYWSGFRSISQTEPLETSDISLWTHGVSN